MIPFEQVKITNHTKPKEDQTTLEKEEAEKSIILFNDEVNTFDFVIKCLMEICEHEELQAEQCTMIVHYNGKCEVKCGSYDDLEPRCQALLDRGLSAEIN